MKLVLLVAFVLCVFSANATFLRILRFGRSLDQSNRQTTTGINLVDRSKEDTAVSATDRSKDLTNTEDSVEFSEADIVRSKQLMDIDSKGDNMSVKRHVLEKRFLYSKSFSMCDVGEVRLVSNECISCDTYVEMGGDICDSAEFKYNCAKDWALWNDEC